MKQIFLELITLFKANCAVVYTSTTQEILYSHNFDADSRVGSQILRLLTRVIKLKQMEYCEKSEKDPLFKVMGIEGSFICCPLLIEEICIGSLYISSSKKILPSQLQKHIQVFTNTYYEILRQQTKETVETETQVNSDRLRRYLSMGMSCGGKKIVGIDPIMEGQVFSCIEMYKSENCSPVLIYGESGTGKELVASALHYRSERNDKTYLRFNCAEITSADPQMQRIELFGCKTGVASGVSERKGLFALSNQGTLFLDEIGLLSHEAQGHLLRVLEDHRIRPVGEKKDYTINVRLICANNEPLQNLVKQGTFRKDLFYRLCSFIINIPPLRQRGINDHDLLIDYFLEEENENNRSHKKISPKAREILHQHHWPGNVRELRATIRRAFYKVKGASGTITENTIEFVTHEKETKNECTLFPSPWKKLIDIEREVFRQACAWAGEDPKNRNQGKVAEMLGIHPNTMTKKLRDYNIVWPKV